MSRVLLCLFGLAVLTSSGCGKDGGPTPSSPTGGPPTGDRTVPSRAGFQDVEGFWQVASVDAPADFPTLPPDLKDDLQKNFAFEVRGEMIHLHSPVMAGKIREFNRIAVKVNPEPNGRQIVLTPVNDKGEPNMAPVKPPGSAKGPPPQEPAKVAVAYAALYKVDGDDLTLAFGSLLNGKAPEFPTDFKPRGGKPQAGSGPAEADVIVLHLRRMSGPPDWARPMLTAPTRTPTVPATTADE